MQIGHTFPVYLHRLHFAGFRHKILCEHSHPRSDFQDGQAGTGIHRVGDAPGDVQIGQEVLTEILFRLD